MEKQSNNILTIDVGGTSVKACILSPEGEPLSEYIKIPTPKQSTPEAILKIIKDLAGQMDHSYDRISMGFPGYVKGGIVFTAPNLAKNKWKEINLAQQVADLLQKPVRLVNDADQQALGIASGKGFEIVLTVGTGFGTALVYDGELFPHFELAHFPISKKKDYDDFIGTKTLDKIGKKDWNDRVQRIIEIFKTVFNYDTLYIGGGNSKHIELELDSNIHLVNNRDGIKGGARLWKLEEKFHVHTTYPSAKS